MTENQIFCTPVLDSPKPRSETTLTADSTTAVAEEDIQQARLEWLRKLADAGDWERLRVLRRSILDQIGRGLEMHRKDPSRWRREESDLMCMDCCLPGVLPTRSSAAKPSVAYGIDFGGSNIRFLRGKFEAANEFTFVQSVASLREGQGSEAAHLPKGLLDPRATATMLFDYVAEKLLEFISEHGDLDIVENCPNFVFPLGFTFSFGFAQAALDAAPLHQWSKDFQTGELTDDPVIGQDVCLLLRQAFTRKCVPVKLVGILNDTTATMLAANINQPFSADGLVCRTGFIFGTGINGCYFEPRASSFGYKGAFVNSEVGGHNHELPYTEIDEENDLMSANVGSQRLEKLISGHYIPELVRRVLLRTFDLDLLPPAAREAYSLTCPGMARIFDATNDLAVVHEVFEDEWCWAPITEQDLAFLRQVIDAVWLRGCRMAGVAISALAEQAGADVQAQVVGIDGSLFHKCHRFRAEVEATVQELTRMEGLKPVRLQSVVDGSGIGAVALAALFNKL